MRVLHAASFQPLASLDGTPIATPRRRVAAFTLDVLLILVPSILVSVTASVGAAAWRQPAAFAAVRQLFANPPADGSPEQVRLLGAVAPLLVEADARGLPASVTVAVESGDLARAGQILTAYDFTFAIGDGSPTLRPNAIRVHLDRFIPDGLRNVATFGVAAIYFTLLTAAGRRTMGKRLMGIRVVKLDGQPLTLWESFERFGGYFAALGTFGLGLRDLWHEPNGRLAHDKLAGTVVLVERADAVVEAAAD